MGASSKPHASADLRPRYPMKEGCVGNQVDTIAFGAKKKIELP